MTNTRVIVLGLFVYSTDLSEGSLSTTEIVCHPFVQVVDMLFALLRHFNWKKFTLIFEETESRPLQTKLKDRVAAEGKAFEMKEAYYVRPGNAKCVTVLVNLRECDHHYLSELIHQTKDNTRSKCGENIIYFNTSIQSNFLEKEASS